VEVEVFSEGTLTGVRELTSRAYLTFVAIDREGHRIEVPPLLLETEAERRKAAEAEARRAARLAAKQRFTTAANARA
jgi:acyl-CoA hydrolase